MERVQDMKSQSELNRDAIRCLATSPECFHSVVSTIIDFFSNQLLLVEESVCLESNLVEVILKR